MKKPLASALALLGCAVCVALAVTLVYCKYKSARALDERAAAALQNSQSDPNALTEALTGHASSAPLDAHMPPPIGSAGNAAAEHSDTVNRILPGKRYEAKPTSNAPRGHLPGE